MCICLSLSSCKLTEFVGKLGVETTQITTAATTAPISEATAPQTTEAPQTDGKSYGEYPVKASDAPTVKPSAVLLFDSGKEKASDRDVISRDPDFSAVLCKDGCELTLDNITLMSSSGSSDTLESRFFGLCAGVLCYPRSKVSVLVSDINTAGNGSAGLFAYGTGAVIDVTEGSVSTTGANSRGLAAAYKGSIFASGCDVSTQGLNSPAIFVGRGAGTINFTGGSASTGGVFSPAVYSSGTAALTGTALSTSASETAVVEGKGTLSLTGCDISSATSTFLLNQTNSGDVSAGVTTLNVYGGFIKTGTGAAFTVSNTTAKIYLQGAEMSSDSSSLLNAIANDKWGSVGENGGNVHLLTSFQKMSGNIYADNMSTVTVELTGLSVLNGSINSRQTAKEVNVILDASSRWNVTGNSFISALTPGLADYSCIKDNGYTIYYDADNPTNVYLNGETITLQDGGLLTPVRK